MALQENIRAEQVGKLEVREAIKCVESDATGTVVQSMRDQNIGCAVVIDNQNKPIGMFTESMIIEQLLQGGVPEDEPIANHMSDRCPWVRITDPISDVVEAMEINNTRLLCVVDENDAVVGITGQRGVMEYVAEHFPGQVMVQRIGQAPYLSDREGA